jgi:hypothetical protein
MHFTRTQHVLGSMPDKERFPMRIIIQADDGDEVAISADSISAEQGVLTLAILNAWYKPESELETLTLTVDKARELATALQAVAEAIEFVRVPANAAAWAAEGKVCQAIPAN